jgi:phage/plasmid-associated DNA primase
MDLLSEFVVDCCEVGPGKEASLSQLWVAWRQWSEPRGEFRLLPNTRVFDRRLRTRWTYNAEKRRYIGVGVKS